MIIIKQKNYKYWKMWIDLILIMTFSSCTKQDDVAALQKVQKEVIVVSEEDSNGILQLFIREIDGSDPVQLTFNSVKH